MFTVLVWFSGVLISERLVVRRLAEAGCVARCSEQIESGSLLETLTAVAAGLKVRRPVTLLLSPELLCR